MPRLMLKDVDEELSKRGHRATLQKAAGYFYFAGGETNEWLDRTVGVRTLNSLTLKQWVEEFQRLKMVNANIMKTASGDKRKKD